MAGNALYYGDNLDILRRYIADESVDLVYLDPPFNSNATYNVLFAEQDGTRAASQIKAFGDTWQWDQAAAHAYQEIVETGGKVSQALQAFRQFLGENDLLAYLCMMAPRLVELRRVLKPTGSIYLHCDPTASHYLKMLMDATFDGQNFLNEIIWRRTASHNQNRRYGPIHDVILFYAKTNQFHFNVQYRPYAKGHVESYFKKEDERGKYWTNAITGAGIRHGDSGKEWKGFDPTTRGRHWAVPGELVRELGIDEDLPQLEKLDALFGMNCIDIPESGEAMPTFRQYLHMAKGIPLQDVWAYQPYTSGVLYGTMEAVDEDVRWIPKQGSPERLGYQTQKPLGLLGRIIESSSSEGDVVLDPFCGCGTAVAVAQRLGRQWIGIDITHLAITLIKHRLAASLGHYQRPDMKLQYQVIGEPVSLPDAEALAEADPYQFQWWALGLVGARPAEAKKGADKGIDGRLYFHDEGEGGKTKQVIFSVKAGHTNVSHVRDLRGVLDRENAHIGVLLTMQEPTKPMRTEAASTGFYKSYNAEYQRLQILTVRELLEGKKVDMPQWHEQRTFKIAPKAKGKSKDGQSGLWG
jgi:DNA modification methylase